MQLKFKAVPASTFQHEKFRNRLETDQAVKSTTNYIYNIRHTDYKVAGHAKPKRHENMHHVWVLHIFLHFAFTLT